MCFKREGVTSTLSGSPLKLVDNISSTERDVDIYLVKVRTATDSLSITWKPDASEELFLPSWGCQYFCVDAQCGHLQNAWIKSDMWKTQVCYVPFWANPLSNTPEDSSCTTTNIPSQKHPSKTKKTCRTIHKRAMRNSCITFIYGAQHLDVVLLADYQELIYFNSVQTLNLDWKPCSELWMIRMDAEGDSVKTMLSWWIIYIYIYANTSGCGGCKTKSVLSRV